MLVSRVWGGHLDVEGPPRARVDGVGDDDGVVVIPPSLLQEVVDDAYEQELQDAWVYEQVKAGHPVDGLFPPDAEWKAAFAEHRATLPQAPQPEGDGRA